MITPSTIAPAAHPFDPAEWLSRFESIGGAFSVTPDGSPYIGWLGATLSHNDEHRAVAMKRALAREQIEAIASYLMAKATRYCRGPIRSGQADAEILAAWDERQRMLTIIESRGEYYDAFSHSPAEAEAHGKAEDRINTLPAITTQGVLAKLWVVITLVTVAHDDNDRALFDVLRRADIASVDAISAQLEYEVRVLFGAIKALAAIGGEARS